MKHETWCQHKESTHEAGQRIADTYNLHRIAGGYDAIGKWFAAQFSDGRGDNVLYDTRLECVLHQKNNEKYYTFIKIGPSGMTACDAAVMVNVARRLFDSGVRMADPERRNGGMDLIKRVMREDQLAMLRGVVRNLTMPWER